MTIMYLSDTSDLSLGSGVNRHEVWSSDFQPSQSESVGHLEWEGIMQKWMFVPETGFAFSQVYLSRIFSLLSSKLGK